VSLLWNSRRPCSSGRDYGAATMIQQDGPVVYSDGMKFSATPLMQYRWPVGGGPSGNT
jgi:hypothetical protein